MTIARIRAKLDERPFRPFDIHTSHGKKVTVRSPDFAWIHPHGRTMYVCPDPNIDADQVIDLRHVTKLSFGRQQREKRQVEAWRRGAAKPMLVDQFDELMEAKPFQPFRIYTSDGRSMPVKSPEFAWHAPASRIVWLASGRGEGRVHMIDLHLVTRFTVNPGNGKGNGRRRQRK